MDVAVLPHCSAVFLTMYLNFRMSSAADYHGVEAVVDLGLAAGAHLVVRALEDEAGVDQLEADVVAEVGLLVDRADGK
ncbi:hypothetical protein Q0F99_18370 [Rathayibacter oskolensis]|uniref:hypothetical protein n=1 Tax=Rathayibacter oskolensis TaxID=1891671 RepID=UPI00265FD084|nr:hypothetical protein [Rathayibacter oskolensis]WKK71361.1 hypothetical protein Q0F99_18370 [Rathayibacter oskolensis]